MTKSKQVRFGEDSYVLLNDGPVESLWYDSSEIMSSRQDFDSDESENNRRRRLRHVRNVLSMQEEINEMGMSDATGLRAYASALSKSDVKNARERAALGASEAFQVYEQSTGWMKGTNAEEFTRTTRLGKVSSAQRWTVTAALA